MDSEDAKMEVSEKEIRRWSSKLADLVVRSGRCADALSKADIEEINLTPLAAETTENITNELRELMEDIDKVRDGKAPDG